MEKIDRKFKILAVNPVNGKVYLSDNKGGLIERGSK